MSGLVSVVATVMVVAMVVVASGGFFRRVPGYVNTRAVCSLYVNILRVIRKMFSKLRCECQMYRSRRRPSKHHSCSLGSNLRRLQTSARFA